MSQLSDIAASDEYRAFIRGFRAGHLMAFQYKEIPSTVCADYNAGYEQGHAAGAKIRQQTIEVASKAGIRHGTKAVKVET